MDIEKFFQRKDRYNIVLDISPDLAFAFLEKCNTHNRNVVDAHVHCLARDMKAGIFRLTHQGIAFSTNRVLLDGQHRLWAVIEAGVTVPMRVFFNEPPESLGAIDAVRARTNDEIITLGTNLGQVSKVDLAILRAMLAGLGSYLRRTAGEEAELFSRHKKAIRFAQEILSTARFRGVATASVRGVLARASYSSDHDKLRHFADVLQSGVASCEEDQPVTLLLQFLIKSAQGPKGRPEMRERYAKTERALSAYLAGEQLSKLYAATTELFPLPEEMAQEAA